MFTTLVTTGELAGHLDDPAWVVFDCRHDLAKPDLGRTEYLASHIPGARFMHMDEDLAGPSTGANGRHPLPDPAVFAAKLGAAGVGPQTQVVAYDAQGSVNASRLWWMLRWLGHDAVAVLDGGLGKWLREERPVTAELPRVHAARFEPRPRPLAVDAARVLAGLRSPAMKIVDARSGERYRGEAEPIDPVAGHIPGSLNRFVRANLEGGAFKPPARLREEFLALLDGSAPETIVHSCGSGVAACHNLLAMEIAGLAGSRLYPGSWSEWIADPARPRATGPTP
ncbi:MAG: sulfurtransferase [Bacteroidota bacterium]|jgi:thiosulfate/3-mercaptopyruvate sulfurtransferase